jgi:nickel/cobalt exporter
MNDELLILVASAASIGFLHTLFGPDHYLPFIVMSKTGKWTFKKTAIVTFLCGVGHVIGSIVLGLVGITLGIAVAKLEILESFRGDFAAWFLIAFGLVYFVWGVRKAIKNKPHLHKHAHNGGVQHLHTHVHTNNHSHVHEKQKSKDMTPWVLFTIFVLGPCEPLIPLLMYPAAQSSLSGILIVAGVFSLVTIVTMLGVVLISIYGISFVPVQRLERYMHAIAGATICLSGMAIQLLGL